MARCISPNCRAEIIWAETPEGSKQPFNREPDPKGNRVLLGRGPDRPPLAIPQEWVLSRGPDEQAIGDETAIRETLYMPHHATCPDAGRFR